MTDAQMLLDTPQQYRGVAQNYTDDTQLLVLSQSVVDDGSNILLTIEVLYKRILPDMSTSMLDQYGDGANPLSGSNPLSFELSIQGQAWTGWGTITPSAGVFAPLDLYTRQGYVYTIQRQITNPSGSSKIRIDAVEYDDSGAETRRIYNWPSTEIYYNSQVNAIVEPAVQFSPPYNYTADISSYPAYVAPSTPTPTPRRCSLARHSTACTQCAIECHMGDSLRQEFFGILVGNAGAESTPAR